MGNHKFDEAALIKNGNYVETVKLEDLAEAYWREENQQTYNNTYFGRIYCPECRCARLTLVNNKRCRDLFLRANDAAEHKECSYLLDTAPFEAYREYIENLSDEDIRKLLKNLIKKMIRNETTEFNPLVLRMKSGKCTDDKIQSKDIYNNRKDLKRQPIKLLTAPLEDDDYGVLKLFYGRVHIKLSEWEKSSSYSLRFRHPNTNKLIITLNFSNAVKEYLEPTITEYDNTVTNIALASRLEKRKGKDGNTYSNAHICNSRFLVIG
ncbi:MAG: hypothetical protein LBI44_04700 [Oscillospiraceae bacterium]|jgi:hypothetical protein|nr:hypothetical protein [Oscillospiraceae bacterium]